MGILKYISLVGLSILLVNCRRITYEKSDVSFYYIVLDQWNSSICPKKVVYERYVKNSEFKNKIKSYSDFVINCNDKSIAYNQRILFPNEMFVGRINYDIRLVIDDSIEYKIVDIHDRIDTVFLGGRPGDYVIMNSIKSLAVNGHQLDNTIAKPTVIHTPREVTIEIPTKIGEIIKK
ncbi:hypothetical protein OIU80_00960 [Flavobacterium sp. LS1R47]|uniref:Uncharacterized protein n=1 Tax=Flavobacterium frigoritolerans TaxID=2987686 RepID=A0A9X3C5P8_9FLAO|nr:hypothetical protein [Flavobacterium frigoritolerans]MCV9930839.1 hypothetical protein [Flavobacterium frigoritolerans]